MKLAAVLLYAAIAAIAVPCTVGVAATNSPAAGEALPSDSIYRLDSRLVDQDAHPRTLADYRGGPVVVAMFYSSCPYMCPLIVEAIKRSEHALDEGQRARLHVVLVSFDSAHDTSVVLKATAAERHIDLSRWTLLRTDPAEVRRIAAALDVQYRALPDGGFNHSGVLTLLDAQGRIAARTEQLGDVDPGFVDAVRKAAFAGD